MTLADLNPEALTSGNLAEHPLNELLGLLFSQRLSGEMRLTHGGHDTRIYAFNGIPINASSTVPGQTITDVMMHDHQLSADDVMQVRQFARDHDLNVVECIRDLLEVGETRIYYFQAKTAREIIIKACGVKDATYSFTESEEILYDVDMYDLNPLEIIYEGVVRHHGEDAAVQVAALEARKVVIQDNSDYFLLPEPLYQHSDLLDAFTNEITIGRAIDMLGSELEDPKQVACFLYLLLVTGLLTLLPEIPDEEIFEDLPAFEDLPEAEDLDPDEHPEFVDIDSIGQDLDTGYIITNPKSGRTKKRGRDKAAKSDSPLREVIRTEAVKQPGGKEVDQYADQRKALVELDLKLKEARTHYELLDVSIGDSPSELQQAWEKKAKPLELRRLPATLPPDLKELADKIRTTYDRAYQELIDSKRRAAYERELFQGEMEEATNQGAKQVLAAKMAIRGEWYLKNSESVLAREFFEHAHELDPENGGYSMNLGWAVFRTEPTKTADAMAHLDQATKSNPSLDQAHYYIGLIFKREGLNEDAEKSFRAALDLNPDNGSAKRELAFLTQHQKQTGLWKKIFGT